MTRLPSFDTDLHYRADWAGTGAQPCGGCGTIYLALELDDGRLLRLRLSPAEAKAICNTLGQAAVLPVPDGGRCGGCRDLSARSSGNPQVAGSSVAEGQSE